MQAFVPITSPLADQPLPHAAAALSCPIAAMPYEGSGREDRLTLRVLRTPDERLAIAGLRKLSASAVEDDLGFGLSPFETVRDQIGLVGAIERDGRAIATIRFVPSGHGMTGLERLARGVALPPGIVVPGSWEVGRLIVAPEERHPELLGQCFALAMTELVRTRPVERFYAIATPLMARLWRRFGMRIATMVRGASGTEYAVVHGDAACVAAALKLPPSVLAAAPSGHAGAVSAQSAPRPVLAH